jgi:hypothetical protein
MEASKKELSNSAVCPCGSGKQYKRCCKKKDFKWMEDSTGKIFRQIPIDSLLAEAIEEEQKRFVKIFGREHTPDDPLIPEMPSVKEIKEATLKLLIESGACQLGNLKEALQWL